MPTRHASPIVHLTYLHGAASLYGDAGPSYATEGSAGLDLRAAISTDSVSIPAGGRFLVPTGIAVSPQEPDIAGFVYSRSGLGAKQGLTVAQGVGVIDPDYRGEIMVMLLNTSDGERCIARGDRIAQLVFQPIFRADLRIVGSLDGTKRGGGGFGHTGTH